MYSFIMSFSEAKNSQVACEHVLRCHEIIFRFILSTSPPNIQAGVFKSPTAILILPEDKDKDKQRVYRLDQNCSR